MHRWASLALSVACPPVCSQSGPSTKATGICPAGPGRGPRPLSAAALPGYRGRWHWLLSQPQCGSLGRAIEGLPRWHIAHDDHGHAPSGTDGIASQGRCCMRVRASAALPCSGFEGKYSRHQTLRVPSALLFCPDKASLCNRQKPTGFDVTSFFKIGRSRLVLT
jgi:hypothetical protein